MIETPEIRIHWGRIFDIRRNWASGRRGLFSSTLVVTAGVTCTLAGSGEERKCPRESENDDERAQF